MKNKFFLACLLLVSVAPAFSQSQQLPVEEFKLKNGLTVKMIQFGTIPALQISAFVNVGKKTEIPGQQSMASLTASGLSAGNEKYSRVTQDDKLAVLGTSISSSSNDNYSVHSLLFLEKDSEIALDIFSSLLLKPLFPSDEIKQEIEQSLNFNNPMKMDISELGAIYSNFAVFGINHPLGRTFYPAQLNKVNSSQLLEFYKFNYTPKNTTLMLAGNFDHIKMKAEITKLFENWTAAYGENNGAAYDVQPINKKEYFLVNRDNATQASLIWNKKAPAGGTKDALLFQIANNAFNEILFDEIRAKEGKTYGIHSMLNESNDNGTFIISTQVRNDVAYETIQSFNRVLEQFNKTGINQAQLNKAKASLKNRRTAIESPAGVISFYNPIIFKNIEKRNEYLPMLESITVDQVNKVLKKYFTSDSYKLVIAGDMAILSKQMSGLPNSVRLEIKDIQKDN